MSDFNTQIIEEFRANSGKVGGMFEGANMVLLHHTGRKSGDERVTPLVYFPDGERIVIVASKGGAPENPAWYHNLLAAPETTIEIGGETRAVRVSEISGAERDQWWGKIVEISPGFGEYQQNISRVIPLLALNPIS